MSGRWLTTLRLALDLPRFLAEPTSPALARDALARRMQERESAFLSFLGAAVYSNPRSPYRALLKRCGCELGDLAGMVHTRGIESSLLQLREEGVYLTFAELRAQIPIRRGGFELPIEPRDLDNVFADRALSGSTGGTRARAVAVAYSWPFIAEEAQNECLLYEQHAIAGHSLALWYPLHGGIAAVHNLLMALRCAQSPVRWFAHSGAGNLREHAMIRYLIWAARRHALAVPAPEVVPLDRAAEVASWMAEALRQGARPVLRTFVSSAVRVARAAFDNGIDLRRATFCVGGEPLTEARYRVLTRTGAAVIPRYVATETGLVGASCGSGGFDEMHVYLDRLAVIPATDTGGAPLLYSTLLMSSAKVLINAELGDSAELQRRPCACVFGQLGMDLHVHAVRSSERCTVEGVAVPLMVIERIVGEIVVAAGGGEEQYQIRELVRADSQRGLGLVIDPALAIASGALLDTFFERLRSDAVTRAAADLWQQSRAVEIIRERPHFTVGSKMPRFVAEAGR